MDSKETSQVILKPKVSVILTSYNHAPYLDSCIRSILDQTFGNFELFIVDDASTDDSPEIIAKYADLDERIRPIFHKQNTCDSNCSIPFFSDQIEGDYIAIAHSDDAWVPDKLQKQVEYLDTNENVAACFTWVDLIDDDGNLLVDSDHFFATAFTHTNRPRSEWLHYFFFEGCPLCHPSLMIRKDAYKDYGLFTKGLSSVPDFCKWIRLCIHADIHVLEERLTLFRVHADESNASGDSYGNRCRVPIEDYLILREYQAISDPEFFLDVFPEAQKYYVDGQIVLPFALAQMGLIGSWKMHKLFALELLYELLQDPLTAQVLQDLYGYDEKVFNIDKTKYDVFGEIAFGQMAYGSLYVEYSDTEEDPMVLEQEYYISSLGYSSLSWDLQAAYKKGSPRRIKFIPDNRCLRRIAILSAHTDSGPVSLESKNSSMQIDDWDVHFSLAPEYSLQTPHVCKTLTIDFKIVAIPQQELCGYLQKLIDIKKSTSWRLTKPLRSIGKLLGRS